MDELILTLDGSSELVLSIDDNSELTLLFASDQSDVPYYQGAYVVTPMLAVEQILETDELRMADDVTVKEIPVTITHNTYGGKTVVIG